MSKTTATIASPDSVPLELHPAQSRALLSPAQELLYGGAAGGGKSHLLRIAGIAWCWLIPGFQAYLIRRKSVDLLANHMEGPTGFQQLLAPWAGEWITINVGPPAVIRFWNGAAIHLGHCQYEKDKYNYQGKEIHGLLVDEATHFLDTQYRFIRRSVRLGGLVVPPWIYETYGWVFPKIILGCNPGGVGHLWVKGGWVDRAPPRKVWRASRGDGGMRRSFLPAKLEDNPTLLKNDPEYEDRLFGIGNPELVKAQRWGDWNIVAGGLFGDLWDAAIHEVDPFPIPDGWTITRSLDWGFSKPFSVGWWAESNGECPKDDEGEFITGGRYYPRGTKIRIGEYYGCKEDQDGNLIPNTGLRMTPGAVAEEILKRELKMGIAHRVKPGKADGAIFSSDDGSTVASQFAAKGVVFKPAPKGPGSRKNGWQVMRDMLEAALQEPMEAPGLVCFNTYRNGLIRTLPALDRDENDADDIDTDSEDHAADEARYELATKRRVGGMVGTTGT